jgi:Xaa-Pro aminopeptidase
MINSFSKSKIDSLLNQLQLNNLDGIIFSTNDEYINEYVPNYYKRLEYLTGFTGSRGLCIVLKNNAAVFVDGRYTLQATNQINQDIFEIKDYTKKSIENWLKDNLNPNNKIGINLKTTTNQEFSYFNDIVKNKESVLIEMKSNLVDDIWIDRPTKVLNPIQIYDKELAGEDIKSKILKIVDLIKKNNLDYYFFTALDSISWLLNIRGSDVPNNPYNLGSLLVDNLGNITFFCNSKKITSETKELLGNYVVFFEEDNLENYFLLLKDKENKKIGISNQSPVYFSKLFISFSYRISILDDLVQPLKAIKNSTEIYNITQAHIKDGVALTKLLYNIHSSPLEYDEISIEQKLQEIKKNLYPNDYVYDSFDYIIGVDEHGAIVHYRATEITNKKITNNSIVLLDSGSQYKQGTTDVTRTISIENPTKEFKRNFTLVLKGLLALSNTVFPEGTTGGQLDVLARQFLWQHQLNYNHGTGHGVGNFLGVHEGPISLHSSSSVQLEAYNVLSIEPGVYLTNQYGIRLENLYYIKEHSAGFLCFSPLTLVPFDGKNIDTDILNDTEISFLNSYNSLLINSLSAFLTKEELEWLKLYTRI